MKKSKLPMVCILGRPNVGKSTLFNALTGKRDAISLNTPGITRDRHFSLCTINKHTFQLVDTGGFETEPEDEMFGEIKGQIWTAVEDSDLVILLLDGVEGLTHDDRDIIKTLREKGKKFIPTVNKIDHHSHNERLYEFYEIGTEELIGISAEHKINLDKLGEMITGVIPQMEDVQLEDDKLRIAILGRPNVGKSSLLNKIIGDYRVIVSEVPGTTRDSIDTDFVYQEKWFTLIDTAGIKKKGKTKSGVEKISVLKALNSIERSDVCVLLIDSQEGITDQDAHILGYILDAGKGVIIAANKWDLVEKSKEAIKEFTENVRFKLKFAGFAPLIFISAKTGQRIFQILELAKDVYENSSYRIPTAEYNKLINDAIKKHPLPIFMKRRIKIFYSTQVTVRPPTFVLVTNFDKAIHFSYLRYLENFIRDNYNFEGVPIRIKVQTRKRK
ncbi:ribosome biogenesis GTPase Der [bacterium]|nr:ribosome biogenesis GTPase Der [bacterium]